MVSALYLHDNLRPCDIEERLRTDHGVNVSGPALRQWLSRRGYTKTRKAADAEVACKISPAIVAEKRLTRANENLARWGAKSEQLVDKALDAANMSTRLRDTALATSTAAQALRIFQMTHGLPTVQPAPKATFNFNFANGPDSPFNPENRRRAQAMVVEAVVVEEQPAV